jgi:hypothetical protein
MNDYLKSIDRLIVRTNKSSLKAHILALIFIRGGFEGVVHKNSFTIWRMSNWSGIGYPVISGEVNGRNIKIRTKPNPLAIGVYSGMLFMIFLAYIKDVLDRDVLDIKLIGIQLFGISILILGFQFVIWLAYSSNKRREVKLIKSLLENR